MLASSGACDAERTARPNRVNCSSHQTARLTPIAQANDTSRETETLTPKKPDRTAEHARQAAVTAAPDQDRDVHQDGRKRVGREQRHDHRRAFDPPQDKEVDQYAEQRAADRNQDDGEPERQLETDDDRNRRERGDRKNVAVREIDHAHDAEDQVEPARHQRVDAAEQYSADEEFRQRHEATSGALQIESFARRPHRLRTSRALA